MFEVMAGMQGRFLDNSSAYAVSSSFVVACQDQLKASSHPAAPEFVQLLSFINSRFVKPFGEPDVWPSVGYFSPEDCAQFRIAVQREWPAQAGNLHDAVALVQAVLAHKPETQVAPKVATIGTHNGETKADEIDEKPAAVVVARPSDKVQFLSTFVRWALEQPNSRGVLIFHH